MATTYYIDPKTFFDTNLQKYGSRVCVNGTFSDVKYIVFGATENESQENAERLGDMLTVFQSVNFLKRK